MFAVESGPGFSTPNWVYAPRRRSRNVNENSYETAKFYFDVEASNTWILDSVHLRIAIKRLVGQSKYLPLTILSSSGTWMLRRFYVGIFGNLGFPIDYFFFAELITPTVWLSCEWER